MTQIEVEVLSESRRNGAAPEAGPSSAPGAGLGADERADRRPSVLLASTCAWPSVPKLAIALAGAGCEVSAATPKRHPLNITLAVTRRLAYRATAPLRSLKEAIDAVDPGLIIACDERVVSHLHRLHAQTTDRRTQLLIERSLGDPEHYGLAQRRQAVIDLASRLGIETPRTRSIEQPEDLRAWGASEPFPWVIKSDGSWGGLGVRIVDTQASALRALRQLAHRTRPLYALRKLALRGDPFWLTPWLHQPPGRVSVQSFVAGRAANCVLAAWRGEVLAGVGVEVVASEGETGPASIVRMARDDQMVEAGARLVRALGLSGLVGFDFVIESATGRALLLEMNSRATPTAHLRLGPGRDLVGALAARLAGRAPPPEPPETTREVIALFPQAEQQCPGDPILGEAYHDRPLHEPQLTQALMRRRPMRRRPSIATALAPAE
jgi:hypothetical protein